MVELSLFKKIPHLLTPVVTDMKRTPAILEWAVSKMEERYALLADMGVKNITGFNELGADRIRERAAQMDVDPESVPNHLPYIVIMVDELADLMMIASKEIENSLTRLAQKSRAVGIHIIFATQRPSVDVITGLIKANFPARLSFRVSSRIDSRTILDGVGAERLLGQGDLLYLPPRSANLMRCQGVFVSEKEIRNVVQFLKRESEPRFNPELENLDEEPGGSNGKSTRKDPLFEEAVRFILETNRGSVSLLQRRFEIGYSRAARLVDQMAEEGIVGKYKGSKAREVMITLEEWEARTA
jgi:S-DNA-T family DNA segregation ATPase FtsK/SpoIIIE